jgi:hypothetical protein
MSVVVVSYPPSAGGNHLKNILCLDKLFANHHELDSAVYDQIADMQGTVHCLQGRNVQPQFIDRIVNHPDQCWLLAGHIGELAPYRNQLLQQSRKFILISIDTPRERRMLEARQHRLGQQNHPYWLEEEQPFFYQSLMYQTYFDTPADDILTVPLMNFWHPTFQEGLVIDQLNSFLNISLEHRPVEILHSRWQQCNSTT